MNKSLFAGNLTNQIVKFRPPPGTSVVLGRVGTYGLRGSTGYMLLFTMAGAPAGDWYPCAAVAVVEVLGTVPELQAKLLAQRDALVAELKAAKPEDKERIEKQLERLGESELAKILPDPATTPAPAPVAPPPPPPNLSLVGESTPPLPGESPSDPKAKPQPPARNATHERLRQANKGGQRAGIDHGANAATEADFVQGVTEERQPK